MKPSDVMHFIIGPRPVVATICVFALYCPFFLYHCFYSRAMAFYVVYVPPLAQVESMAQASDWRDAGSEYEQEGHRQRIRFLTVESPLFTTTVKELEDQSTSERRLELRGILLEARPWDMVVEFAEGLIPFAIICFALIACWRAVRRWYVARRRGIDRQQGFEVL